MSYTLLGIDIETTGLDGPEANPIIEVGLVLWDTSLGLIECASNLVSLPSGHVVPPKIEALTGITNEALFKYGENVRRLLRDYSNWKIDFIVAHNAEYEQSYCQDEEMLWLNEVPWIDTMIHIPYGEMMGSGNLLTIAQMHGLHNPFPHRAMFDALTMMRVLERYDIEEVIARSKAEWLHLMLKFEYDDSGYMQEKARELGYKWHPKPIKQWRQKLLSCDYERHLEDCARLIDVVPLKLESEKNEFSSSQHTLPNQQSLSFPP